jgi:hypothetical protein
MNDNIVVMCACSGCMLLFAYAVVRHVYLLAQHHSAQHVVGVLASATRLCSSAPAQHTSYGMRARSA